MVSVHNTNNLKYFRRTPLKAVTFFDSGKPISFRSMICFYSFFPKQENKTFDVHQDPLSIHQSKSLKLPTIDSHK